MEANKIPDKIKNLDPTKLNQIDEYKTPFPIHYILPLKDGRLVAGFGDYMHSGLILFNIENNKINFLSDIDKIFDRQKQINHVCDLNDGSIAVSGSDNSWKIFDIKDNKFELQATYVADEESGTIYQVHLLSNNKIATCSDSQVVLWKKSKTRWLMDEIFQLKEPCYQMYEIKEEKCLMVGMAPASEIIFLNIDDLSELTDKKISDQDSGKYNQEICRLEGNYKDMIVSGSADEISLISAKNKEKLYSINLTESRPISCVETIPGTDSILCVSLFYNKEFQCHLLRFDFNGEELELKQVNENKICTDLIRAIRILNDGKVVLGCTDNKIRLFA